jgi:hypothetical protein
MNPPGILPLMLWLLPLVACSADPASWLEGDPTCENGDVNETFKFLGLDVTTEPETPHRVDFSVKLSASAPVELTCTLVTDPDEVHRVISDADLCHEIVLYGMVSDRDYDCTLTSLTAVEQLSLRTHEEVANIPGTSVLEHDESQRTGAYTLVAHLEKTAVPNQLKLLILDPEGRVRWSHFVGDNYSGDLDAQYLGDDRIFYGGALGIPPTIVKLSGRTEWLGPSPSTEGQPHHHVELLDDGDVLMLSTQSNTDEIGEFTGFAAEKLDLYAGTVRWTFESQVAVDLGQLGRSDDDRDPWHPNALVWVDDSYGEGVLASLYEIRQILRLDPDTDEILWRLGTAGDFTLLDADGEPLGSSNWFKASHAPELDGDKLLFYDNGNSTTGTRIVELTLDTENWTAQESWSWTEEGWQEPIWGDVDDLGNGHLLITRGHCDECSGANSASRSEILELNRETEEVVWRVRFPRADDGLYRAQRIDGCAIFANEKYCD